MQSLLESIEANKNYIDENLNTEFCRYISVKYNKPFVTTLNDGGGRSTEGSDTSAVLNKILPPKGE